MSYLHLDATGGLKNLPFHIWSVFPQIVYVINFGRWLLTFMSFLPISLVVTLNLAKFIQGVFITWDASMYSFAKGIEPKVQTPSLAEDLGSVSYVITDKTGTVTQNELVFRKMSIAGVSYGQDEKDCEDAYKKDVTNFNMVDSDLNKLIKSISSGSNDMYEST
jgi:P-type E1-E2 ATPase